MYQAVSGIIQMKMKDRNKEMFLYCTHFTTPRPKKYFGSVEYFKYTNNFVKGDRV
jgi:hypothetical protein